MANETMTLISTVTVGAGGVAAFDFSGIPQTFTDLLVLGSIRDNASATSANINIVFNNDSGSNYAARRLVGNGSSAYSDGYSPVATMPGLWINSNTATANTFGNFSLYIPNYTGSTYKSVSMDSVTETNATGTSSGLAAGIWNNTSAINRIAFGSGSTILQYSSISIYGILKGSGGATVS